MSDEVLSSSWCTNWGAFNTPRLWAMVSDEDDPDAWRQVAAWSDVAGAVQEHRTRLVEARDSLTAAWPPEQNGAAQAFVAELNTLIARMDTAQTDADTTATGLANILEALRTAKNDIQPLYEEYKDKNSDWVPGWWDNAEDEIDKLAQDHMIRAEQTVEQHVAQLKVPDPYKMNPADSREPPPKKKGTGGSGSGGSGSTVAARSGAGSAPPAVPHDPVPPLPGQEAIVPDPDGGPDGSGPGGSGSGGSGSGGSGSGGPGLAGVITPPGATSPGVVTPPTGGGTAPGGVPPVIGGSPLPGVIPGLGGGAASPRGVAPVRGGPAAGGARGAMPSGAVIGESVGGGGRGLGRSGLSGEGLGVGGSGRSAAGGRGVTGGRSGPGGEGRGAGSVRGGLGGEAGGVGGTGRGGSAGRGLSGRSVGGRGAAKPKPPSWLPEEEARAGRGAVSSASGLHGGGARRRGEGSQEQQPFDPDNPWEVAEGVDPVISPVETNDHHDPGPNVIGWHG